MEEKLDLPPFFRLWAAGTSKRFACFWTQVPKAFPRGVELRGYCIQGNSKRHNAILTMLDGHKS